MEVQLMEGDVSFAAAAGI